MQVMSWVEVVDLNGVLDFFEAELVALSASVGSVSPASDACLRYKRVPSFRWLSLMVAISDFRSLTARCDARSRRLHHRTPAN